MYNTIISHLCLELTEKGTIVNCYISNPDEIQPKQLLGENINDLLPFPVGRDFLEAIAQVVKTQNLTTLRYSLSGSNDSDRSEQFYEVKLIPAIRDDRGNQEKLSVKNQVLAFISNITEPEQELTDLRESNQDLETCLNERTYALRLANEQLWETLSELQEVEKNLSKTEGKFNTIKPWTASIGIWDWNLKTNEMYIDPILKGILGYADEEIKNHWDDWKSKIYLPDIDKIYLALQDYELGLSHKFEVEYRIFHKDGTMRWFLANATGNRQMRIFLNRLIGSITDITDRKAMEEALQESEERFRSIFNQAAIGIAQISLNGKYLQVNQKLCDILGYSQEQLLGESFVNFVYEEDRDSGKNYLKFLINGEIPSYSLEQRYQYKNRGVVWTNVTASVVRKSDGTPQYFIMVVQDISDRHQAEFALEYSERRYRAIVEDQTELVCRFFPDGTLTFVNHAYCEYFGQSYYELIGSNYIRLLSPKERQIHQKTLTEIAPEQPVKTLEYSLHHPNGTICWQQWNIRGFFNNQGCLVECQGVGRDISDRVRAEAERDRFFSISLDLLGIASFDGYFKRLNPAWERILGYPIEELLSKPFIEFSHPEDRLKKLKILENIKQGIIQPYFENRYLCKDGSHKWISWSVVPFPEEGLVYAVGRDITEQKQIEAQIQASLEEKDVLLKEIHHRVKNNLQIVCSLLELQSQCSADPKVIAMFKESQLRIRSMSLVHETLYQSNGLGHLDFTAYLREISVNLCTSYGYSPQILNIQSRPEKIRINLDTAIQCGLILNELLTNAFKYAFSDKTSAKIDLSIQALSSGEFLLMVRDNGIGLPENFNVENTQTLGWRVICALTRKLKGRITVTSNHGHLGTQVNLKFSKIKQKSAQAINRSTSTKPGKN